MMDRLAKFIADVVVFGTAWVVVSGAVLLAIGAVGAFITLDFATFLEVLSWKSWRISFGFLAFFQALHWVNSWLKDQK